MTEKEKRELYLRLVQGNMNEDIIVIEDYQRMPFMGIEYLTQYFYIGLCISGYSKGLYDYKNFCFKAGDICWLLPNHVIRHDELSDDYAVLHVFVNKSYYQNLNSRGLLPRHYYPFFVTSISLDPQQFDLMLHGFRMIGKLACFEHQLRDELVCKMLDVLALLGDEFIKQKNPTIKKRQIHHIQLFEQFYTAIVQHYRESHEVAYYAGLLSLTPKYFASVIKLTTEQSALSWINNYVLTQAKWLLRHDHQKTIQQIASHLGFTEQASFSRFFKFHSGVSPTEFREKG